MTMAESALAVLVPEAEVLVGPYRHDRRLTELAASTIAAVCSDRTPGR